MESTVLEADIPTTATDIGAADQPQPEQLVDDELLVEEISIDGMCGVY